MEKAGNQIILTADVLDLSSGSNSLGAQDLFEFSLGLEQRPSLDLLDPASTTTIPYEPGLYERLGGAIAVGHEINSSSKHGD